MKKSVIILLLLLCGFAYGQTPMYKLLGRQTISPPPGCPAEALVFIDSTNITGDDSTAICTLVQQLKDSAIWSKFDLIYPFIGSSSTTQAFNLISPSTFKLTFSGSWAFDASGADPAAANTAYAQTGYTPNSSGSMTTSSTHISIDITESSGGGGADNFDMGSFNGTSQAIIVSSTSSGGLAVARNLSVNLTPASGGTIGMWTSTHTTSANSYLFKNDTQLISTSSDSGSLPSLAMYLGNINLSGSPYSSSAAGRKMDFATAGTGLTGTEIRMLYNILQTYKTAVGR